MEKKIINFKASGQSLQRVGGIVTAASDTVNYFEAHFELDEGWLELPAVRAMWSNGIKTVPAVLNHGVCTIPSDVLADVSKLKVNLVGSVSENGVLTDRLTTFQCPAFGVTVKVPVDGTDPEEIPASQIEQFVEVVKEDADRAEASATASAQSASDAQGYANDSAQYAQASATSASNASISENNARVSERNAEVYKNQAHEEAQDASESAANAQNYAEDAEDARDEIRSMRAEADTLPEGSDATASYSNGVLTLGIPRGDKGDIGETPNLSVGAVQTLPPTGQSEVAITGTKENPVLNFKLVKGEQGIKGDTGNGIASIELTSTSGAVKTYTITFTDGTTFDYDVTDGEVTFEEFYKAFVTDTASGNPASFPDGADEIPMKSVVVDLEPIQDLHGYGKPWAEGAGVNILDPNIKFPSGDQFGLTVTTDGYNYKFVGTATSSGTFETNAINSADAIILPAGDYYLKSGRADLRRANGTSIVNQWAGAFTMTEPFYVRNIYWAITSGQTYNSENFIELVKGSTAPTSWTPYSNICPIYGHTQSVVEQRGINVWDEEWEVGGIDGTTGENTTSSTNIRGKNYCRCVPNTDYYMFVGTTGVGIRLYNADKSYVGYLTWNSVTNKKFTTPTDAYYFRVAGTNAYGATYNHDISINYPSTDHDYHAYQGDTYTTQFGRTVYGGSVDLVSGVLTVDMKYDQMTYAYLSSLTSTYIGFASNITTVGGNAVWVRNWNYTDYPLSIDGGIKAKCNAFPVSMHNKSIYSSQYRTYFGVDSMTSVAEFLTAVQALETSGDGLWIAHELATPTTIQLTPQEIDSFKGNNNLWASTGEIEVEYRADIGLYIANHGGGTYDTWQGGSY